MLSVGFYTFGLAQSSTCASTDVHEDALNNSEDYQRSFAALEEAINRMKADRNRSVEFEEVYSVPVVVHIMHTGSEIGTKENITEEQILSAINGLNEDFRKVEGTNGDGLGVDVAVGEADVATHGVDAAPLPTHGRQARFPSAGVPFQRGDGRSAQESLESELVRRRRQSCR